MRGLQIEKAHAMNSIIKTAIPYLAVFVPLNFLALVIVLAFLGRLKDSPPYFFALGAVVSFGLVILFVVQSRGAGATTAMLVLFILCVVFAYFPQLDSISAGLLNVKLGRNLDRAEEILGRLKNLASIDAKVTYTIMGWSNRWNGMPLKEKQSISDQIDTQLKSYGISDVEISSIKGQYVGLIRYDLGAIFEMALNGHVVNNLGSGNLKTWIAEWNANGRLSLEKVLGASQSEFARSLKGEIPREDLKPDDVIKFEKFADHIGTIYAGCMERHGYTTEAINFFNEVSLLAGDKLVAYVLK